MKVGMLLEGGAMRAMFTAGVLDVMLENDIPIDGIIGVSAGALFGPNYFSKQRGRVIRLSKRYAKDKRYISIRNLLLTGNMVSKNFAYYKVNYELDRFDDETFQKSNKGFWAVATNVETGKAEYFKIESAKKDMEKLRASSAMPFVSKMVQIDEGKYLDGGISDAIPINKLIEDGYDKMILILTQPYDYRKKPLDNKKSKMIHMKFKKYPNLIGTMEKRYQTYNQTMEVIQELENKNKIFVIRPNQRIDIHVVERDEHKLQEVYEMGIKEGKENIEKLKKYLN